MFDCTTASQVTYLDKLCKGRPEYNGRGVLNLQAIQVYPGFEAEPKAGPDECFFYRPGQILLAFKSAADVPTFQAYLESRSFNPQDLSGSYARPDGEGYPSVNITPAGSYPLGVARFSITLPAGSDISEVCHDLESAGYGDVTPNHVVFGCPVWALEPMGDPGPPSPNMPGFMANTTGARTRVAVVDSGLPTNYRTNNMLANVVTTAASELEPYDWVAPRTTINWPQGHGAFVAGVVVQAAGAAMVASFRVLDKDNTTDEWTLGNQLLADVLPWTPDIINLSLGGLTMDGRSLVALDWLSKKVLPGPDVTPVIVVAAAGNLDTSKPFFPAAYDWTISVGATDRVLGRERACFSDYGDNTVRAWVDVCANGTDVSSAFPAQVYRGQPPRSQILRLLTGYATWNGTSFATPHVAGVVAGLLATIPGLRSLGPAGVIAELAKGSLGRVIGPAGAVGPYTDLGWYVS